MFRDRVAQLRPLFAPPDPASRTAYSPGELAQCDPWFPPVEIPVGHGQSGKLPVLVMVSGYSRVTAARMLPLAAGAGSALRALAQREQVGCELGCVDRGRVAGELWADAPPLGDEVVGPDV